MPVEIVLSSQRQSAVNVCVHVRVDVCVRRQCAQLLWNCRHILQLGGRRGRHIQEITTPQGEMPTTKATTEGNNRRQQQKQRRRRRAQNVFYGLFKCLRKQQSEARCDVASDSAVTIVRAFASHCSLFCLLSLTPLSYSHLSLPSLTSLSHSPLPLTLSNSLKTPTPPYCV